MEKITPKVDLAFKKIFGVEENKDLLIALLQEDETVDKIMRFTGLSIQQIRQLL